MNSQEAGADGRTISYRASQTPADERVTNQYPTYHLYWVFEMVVKKTPMSSKEVLKQFIATHGTKMKQEHEIDGLKWQTLLSSNNYFEVRLLTQNSDLSVLIKLQLIDGDYEDLKNRGNRVSKLSLKYEESFHSVYFTIPTDFKVESKKLTVMTELSILKGVGGPLCSIQIPSCTLGSDLLAVIDFEGDKMVGSDVVLVVKFNHPEGEKYEGVSMHRKFSAHKFMLAARSPVFAAMFNGEAKKKNERTEVEICDMEPQVLKEMLKFIYTGKIDSSIANDSLVSVQLLCAAEKYRLFRLRTICERNLTVGLSIENAAEKLVIGHKHNAQHLKQEVLKFIAVNGESVLKTKGWETVKQSYKDLMAEVLDTIFNSSDVNPPASKRAKC